MRLHWILAGVFLIVLTACSGNKNQEEKAPIVRIEKAVVEGSGKSTLYPGRTKASDDANLAFRVSGTLQRVYVKEGDRVRKGQLVAELDPRDYKVQLSATEAEYKQVKADAERVIGLYKDNATTPSNYDKAVYGLQQITAKYNNHKNQLADTRLYAPFDGFVQDCLHESHETVGAGMPIVRLFGANALEVVINIPALEYQSRDNFASFACSFDVLPNETYPLTLINIDKNANANQLYTMRLRLSDANKVVTPGMTTMVSIQKQAEGVQKILIPTTSLLNTGNGSQVFIYDEKTQTIALKPVTVSRLTNGGMAEISAGVGEGEQVVTAGVHSLKDKQKVRVLAPASKTNVGGLL